VRDERWSPTMILRTRMPLSAAPLVALGLLAAPAPTLAGELAAEARGGYFGMTAVDSAKAVFDSSAGFTWGAAGRYSFDLGIYVAGGVRTFSKEGERVFVARPAGPVARLDFPLKMTITPIFATAGYRFRQGKTIVPYAGLGGSITLYREESEVVGVPYEESKSKAGFHVVGGVEVGRGLLRFGAEVGWSTVPRAVGFGGVSEVYGEDDLGGWSVVGKVVIAFGGRKGEEQDEGDSE
jgi:hypothetical protein